MFRNYSTTHKAPKSKKLGHIPRIQPLSPHLRSTAFISFVNASHFFISIHNEGMHGMRPIIASLANWCPELGMVDSLIAWNLPCGFKKRLEQIILFKNPSQPSSSSFCSDSVYARRKRRTQIPFLSTGCKFELANGLLSFNVEPRSEDNVGCLCCSFW